MQTSSQPKLLPVPFADAGSKQNIPNDSQIGITAGRASYVDGFPPLTRTPLAAGGVPPFGTDFNGVLNDITSAVRWAQSGAGYPFSASFNTAIGGYPKGAKIPNSSLDGFWVNTVDGNQNNPETIGGSLTGWIPSDNSSSVSISGLSGSSLTLTPIQASKDRILLSGTLTSNINLIAPAWPKKWIVENKCAGNFSVTFKTANGSGVVMASGTVHYLIGDGTNVIEYLGSAAYRTVGATIGTNQIPDMSYFFGAASSAPYQRFPSGLVIQAAAGTIPASGTGSIVFPATFSTNTASVVLTATASQPSNYIMTVGSITNSGATVYGTTANSGSVPITGTAVGFRYIAFGY